MKNFIAISAILIGNIWSTGCKKPNQTRLNSLEHYTQLDNQADNPNDCSGDFTESANPTKIDVSALSDGDRPLFKGYVQRALSAIPDHIKTSFFQHGNIRLVADAAPECRKILTETGQKSISAFKNDPMPERIDACWDLRALPEVTILLSANATVIAHSTVRLFAFLHTDIFSKIVDHSTALGNEDHRAKLGNQTFKEILRLLPYALIEDSKNDPRIDVRQMKKILQTGNREEISKLQDTIYAETFDSRYCSNKTRRMMHEKFETTALVFAGNAEAMKRAEASRPASRPSLALTDNFRPMSETVYRDDQYHYRTTVTEDQQVELQYPRQGQAGTHSYSYLNQDEYYTRTTPIFAGGVRGFSYQETEYSDTTSNLIYGPLQQAGNAVSWAGNSLYGMWFDE